MYFAKDDRYAVVVAKYIAKFWSVKFGRYQRDVIRVVLNVETFTHFNPRDFGDGIGFGSVAKRTGKQQFFVNRLRHSGRVYLGASYENKFLYIVSETFAYNVVLNLQVSVYYVRLF